MNHCSATAKTRSDTSVTNEEKVKPGQPHSAASEVKCTAYTQSIIVLTHGAMIKARDYKYRLYVLIA